MAKVKKKLSSYNWSTSLSTGVGKFTRGECEQLDSPSNLKLTENSVANKLQSCNGYFAVVSSKTTHLIAAVDHLRTYPLYYSTYDDTFYLSDDPHWIQSKINSTENREHRIEYLLFGYSLGPETRATEIKQLQSGEYLVADLSGDSPSVETEQYLQYPDRLGSAPQYQDHTEVELLNQLDRVLTNTFERLKTVACGRPLVVSLSGGYDSRLVLLMLLKIGYEDVYAYTHGTTDDPEVQLCRDIAGYLNVPWTNVEYTHQEWYDWYRSSSRSQLNTYMDELASVPTQDGALAVEKLQSQDWLPEDAIILNGDSASTTGEHIPREFLESGTVSTDDFLDELLDFHVRWDSRSRWSTKIDDRLRTRLTDLLPIEDQMSSDKAATTFEIFDWRERQSKFIPRHHIYSFYGYDWWLPLWDKEYMDFWNKTPIEYRFDKRLHRKFTTDLMAEIADIPKSEAQDTFRSSESDNTGFGSIIETFDDLVKKSNRVDRIIRPLYFRLARDPPQYHSDPKFGIMSEEFFNKLHLGDDYIHGYRILDSLGYISIQENEMYDLPEEVHLPRW